MNTYPIVIAISILLVILWTYASLSKFFAFEHFKQAMATQVFPVWIGKILVWLLPLLELALVGLLIFKDTRLTGLYASFALMSLFTLYVAGAVYNIYERFPCACGGLFARLSWKRHYKVNIFFTLIALLGILLLESGK